MPTNVLIDLPVTGIRSAPVHAISVDDPMAVDAPVEQAEYGERQPA